jgi:DNA-binding response OmpR family regulator
MVLSANVGRVVSRAELSRQAGLAQLSERRCDSVLVGLRRRLGPDAIKTVRSRGWMLHEQSAVTARKLLE